MHERELVWKSSEKFESGIRKHVMGPGERRMDMGSATQGIQKMSREAVRMTAPSAPEQ